VMSCHAVRSFSRRRSGALRVGGLTGWEDIAKVSFHK
jgi:hypothetical protein